MIVPPTNVRVLIATKPVDFRKGVMGLAAIVEAEFKADPFSGVIYVFRSKRADRVKLLFWDGTGVCLLIKRLEDGKFSLAQDRGRRDASVAGAVVRASRGAGVDPRPRAAGSAAHGDAITCRRKSQQFQLEAAAQISETAVMIAASPDALPNDVDALRALVLAERAEKRLLIEERDGLGRNATNSTPPMRSFITSSPCCGGRASAANPSG